MTLEQIAAAIRRRQSASRPVLIGIEGYGGSGKTTLANQLADALGSAYVVHMDDFIVKDKLTEPSWDTGVFDWQRLERQVLAPLHQGYPGYYQRLVWATNSLSDMVAIPQVDYLIVEGITAYYPTISWYYDSTIWVDTPPAIAQQRGRARDGSSDNAALWDLWASNDSAYQRTHHPKRRADYIFDGGAAPTPKGD